MLRKTEIRSGIDLLSQLGWSKTKLAKVLGVSKQTVSVWGADFPKYAMAYLKLLADVKDMEESFPHILRGLEE